MNNHQGWIASLSNGETVFETPAIAGEHSAWQTLLRRLKAENLSITMLRLQHGKNTVMAARNADGFLQAYKVTKSVFSGLSSEYHGIGSIFGDRVFVTWMNATGESWQEVVPLLTMRIHSTIDWQNTLPEK